MPKLAAIIWITVHMGIAFLLNTIAGWFGWINYAEIFTAYFVILAFNKYSFMLNFWIQYEEDPDMVEQMMRNSIETEIFVIEDDTYE